MKVELNSCWNLINFFDTLNQKESNNKITIYLDNKLTDVESDNTSNIKLAWVLESPMIGTHNYDWIIENNNKFSYVFTHQKKLLDKGENYLYCPSCGTSISDYDKKIYFKNKIISIIASVRNYLEGHKLRHDIILKYKNILDIYGNGGVGDPREDDISGGGYNPIDYKLDGLKDYAFSITVENTQKDYYFSEKLLDCFVTGTVPIYWGCPSIDKFFNKNGMIIFNNIDELEDILHNLSFEKYYSMIDAIKENFELAKKYYDPMKYMYENYPNIFLD